jgi:hypothetical protein
MKNTGSTAWQRVVLHLRCIFHRPRQARLHFAGIAREFHF